MALSPNRQLLNEFNKFRHQRNFNAHLGNGEKSLVRINYDERLGMRMVGSSQDLEQFRSGVQPIKMDFDRVNHLVSYYHYVSPCDTTPDNCVFHIERMSYHIPKPRTKYCYKALIPDLDIFTGSALTHNLAQNLKSTNRGNFVIQGVVLSCDLVEKDGVNHLIITCHVLQLYNVFCQQIDAILAALGYFTGGYHRNWFAFFYDNDDFRSILAYTYERTGTNVLFPFCPLHFFKNGLYHAPKKFTSTQISLFAQRLIAVPGFYDTVSLWLELGWSTPRQQIMVLSSTIHFLCEALMGGNILRAAPIRNRTVFRKVLSQLNKVVDALTEVDDPCRVEIKRNLRAFNKASLAEKVSCCFSFLHLDMEHATCEALKQAEDQQPSGFSTIREYQPAEYTALVLANTANMIFLRMIEYTGPIVDLTVHPVVRPEDAGGAVFPIMV
ncbi:hypothetical protein [Chitinophaga arvensicola]|uniref:Uncharacterized protein n=1 Tax=Chitinophaga arvensicola TaxID=29529 RepID=A0A1I0PQV8_9BACT|nr:hypothetical protein [Chitinophaga arvensicola]SEW16782.1 hypothetical protein SAMN04488122_0922 [Chitinophaga arvensicola]